MNGKQRIGALEKTLKNGGHDACGVVMFSEDDTPVERESLHWAEHKRMVKKTRPTR